MSSISTFGTFGQARLAIYASQKGLSVTGNNIANINTEGYTRQRLEQRSFPASGADRYSTPGDSRIGNGVRCTGLSQLRDPYLDIRYRGQNSNVGAMDAKLGGLEGIQAILDEVGDGDDGFGILSARFNEVYNALQNLSDQTGIAIYDTQVRAAAQSLTNQFRSYASRLQEYYEYTDNAFKEDVRTVNGILTNIRDLSTEIRKSDIHGEPALELRDERNLLIDQLSEYIKIDAVYTTEDIGGGASIEKLIIKLGGANPDLSVETDSTILVDGTYSAQFNILNEDNYDLEVSELRDVNNQLLYNLTKKELPLKNEDGDPISYTEGTTYDPVEGVQTIITKSGGKYYEYTRTPSEAVKLDDNDLYGALQSIRELLTEEGEFASADTITNVDENAAGKRGIKYYQKSLDSLANKFATMLNEANQGYLRNEKGEYVDASGNAIVDGSGNKLTVNTELTDDQKAILEANGEKRGFNLFSTRGDSNDADGITASNISVSSDWASGKQIVTSFVKPTGLDVASTDNSNVIHMVALFSKANEYEGATGTMFTGTFEEMWDNIGFVLGSDMDVTGVMLDNYYTAAVELDSSRDAVSSVDLNDEAMNLMQYSKSYNAACRLMTTLDSMLDKLINGTGLTT